jgi:hypothetical protein
MDQDPDKLLRSATQTLEVQIATAGELTPADLYHALATEATLQAGGMGLQTVTTFSADRLMRSEGSLTLGKAIFLRWNRTLYEFVCTSNDQDTKLKDQLVQALMGQGGGAALVAGVLVSAFGLQIVTATLIAPLLVGLIIVPAREGTCQYWKEKLGEAPK